MWDLLQRAFIVFSFITPKGLFHVLCPPLREVLHIARPFRASKPLVAQGANND